MTANVRITAAALARRLGVSIRETQRRIALGEIELAAPSKHGVPYLIREDVLAALTADPPVRIPGHVWAQIERMLPNATPANLATEVAGALRAAASSGGIGRRLVTLVNNRTSRQ